MPSEGLDLYEILQVSPRADPDVIHRAYRVLAAKIHPDRGGSQEAMKVLNHAYAVLSDPQRRAEYDGEWTASCRSHTPPPRPSPTEPKPHPQLRPRGVRGILFPLFLLALLILIGRRSGIWPLVALVGAVAVLVGLWGLAFGRVRWARIPSRGAGAAVVGGGLILCVLGAAASPSPVSQPSPWDCSVSSTLLLDTSVPGLSPGMKGFVARPMGSKVAEATANVTFSAKSRGATVYKLYEEAGCSGPAKRNLSYVASAQFSLFSKYANGRMAWKPMSSLAASAQQWNGQSLVPGTASVGWDATGPCATIRIRGCSGTACALACGWIAAPFWFNVTAVGPNMTLDQGAIRSAGERIMRRVSQYHS